MITKKRVKIDKKFADHIYEILKAWILEDRLKYTTKDVVDSINKLKEIFRIKYKDTILRRGINTFDFDHPQKGKVIMTSNFELQPWTNHKFNSSFFKKYNYIVEAKIPSENILLSYEDRKIIIQKLSKKLNKNYYNYEKEWMIYLPTKKIKLTKLNDNYL